MEHQKIWSFALALAMLIIIWAIAYGMIQSHVHDLNIRAYIDCLDKYQMAKQSGKIPSDIKPPAGSEVCAKYK